MFWFSNGFVSANTADQNKPIQRVTRTHQGTGRGLECVMPMTLDLDSSSGVVGDNLLDSNEVAIDTDYQSIRYDQLHNAVSPAAR